jgi:hypothetical protein
MSECKHPWKPTIEPCPHCRIEELERDRDHGPMTGARAIDQQRRRADKAERELAETKITLCMIRDMHDGCTLDAARAFAKTALNVEVSDE